MAEPSLIGLRFHDKFLYHVLVSTHAEMAMAVTTRFRTKRRATSKWDQGKQPHPSSGYMLCPNTWGEGDMVIIWLMLVFLFV
jgi:hypothetical protein